MAIERYPRVHNFQLKLCSSAGSGPNHSIEPTFEQVLQSLDAEKLRRLLVIMVEKKPHLIDDIQNILSGDAEDEDDFDTDYDDSINEY